jgi:hypothetical protein
MWGHKAVMFEYILPKYYLDSLGLLKFKSVDIFILH